MIVHFRFQVYEWLSTTSNMNEKNVKYIREMTHELNVLRLTQIVEHSTHTLCGLGLSLEFLS
jgi:hypothetical protein